MLPHPDPAHRAWLELHWLHACLAPGEALVVAARGDEVLNRVSVRRGLAELAGFTKRSVEHAGGVIPFAVKTGAVVTGAALLMAVWPQDADLPTSDEAPSAAARRLVRVAAGVTAHRLVVVGVGEAKDSNLVLAWHRPLWSASWTWPQLKGAPVVWSEGRVLGKPYVDLDLGEGVEMRSFRFFPRAESPSNLDDARTLMAHVTRSVTGA